MALQLKACIHQECDGIEFSDTTKEYDAEDNTGGYGGPNVITGPSDFDTYTLTFWDAALDPSVDTPTAVIDLLLNVPTQAADETYTWPTYTFEDLGVTSISDGVAYFEVVGVKDGDEYRNDFTATFTKTLYDTLKVKMAAWRPGTQQKQGCLPVQDLWNALMDVRCGAVCSKEQATNIIQWLNANLNNICC